MPAVMPNHLGRLGQGCCSPSACSTPDCSAHCASRLSTSWAVGEVFGWAHSLNKSVREAPWFYVVYLVMLLSAGVVSLVASIDVQNGITIFVQVVAVTLLPAALVFLILLLNDKPLMGEYVNTRWQNFVNWAIVIFVIVISTVFGVRIVLREVVMLSRTGRFAGVCCITGDAMTAIQRAEDPPIPPARPRTIASSISPSC